MVYLFYTVSYSNMLIEMHMLYDEPNFRVHIRLECLRVSSIYPSKVFKKNIVYRKRRKAIYDLWKELVMPTKRKIANVEI